jgi:uncharacterized protein (TIGR00255 family)
VGVLFSMTGFGEARYQGDTLSVAVELRALNNRYLKISVRSSEPHNALEPEIERLLRQSLRRGTIQVQLQVRRQPQGQDYQLNAVAVRSYLRQLHDLQQDLMIPGETIAAGLLSLPGVVVEPDLAAADPGMDWAVVARVLEEALAKLQAMRREEGEAMGRELLQLRQQIVDDLDQIRTRAPRVIEAYRDRLFERVRNLLSELDVELDRSELIKEVSIFAERSDITEEAVRLGSHLDQFLDILQEPESPGRKLEFLTQEMFREANTIGSKGNDVEIAKHVVAIKSAIEKIRELIQNIE